MNIKDLVTLLRKNGLLRDCINCNKYLYKLSKVTKDYNKISKDAVVVTYYPIKRPLTLDNYISKLKEKGGVLITEMLPDVFKVMYDIKQINFPVLFVYNGRFIFNFLAYQNIKSKFNKEPLVLGITGTKGKSSTMFFIQQLLYKYAKRNVMGVGAAGIFYNTRLKHVLRTTTPAIGDVIDLLLDVVTNNPVDTIVFEISSHAIAQSRLAGVHFDALIYTGFEPEHLSYHNTVGEYLLTKLTLALWLKRDKESFIVYREPDYKLEQFKYLNIPPAKLLPVDIGKTAQEVKVSTKQVLYRLDSHRIVIEGGGASDIINTALAIKTVKRLGVKLPKEIKLGSLGSRMDRIWEHPLVYIDYAHTPVSVKRALSHVAKLKQRYNLGKLIVSIGISSGKDTQKRREIGAIVKSFADVIVYTPMDYSEDEPQEKVFKDMELGDSPKVFYAATRLGGLRLSVEIAKPNDIVLVLGKGAENYLITPAGRIEWNEVGVIRKLLERGL